jgi:hypothetical protein
LANRQQICQSLTTTGPAVITANGLHHELMGKIVFPWGPEFLGGPIGWHGFTLVVIAFGIAMLLGTLGVIRLPVLLMCGTAIFVCSGLILVSAIYHQQFHALAFTSLIATIVTTVCYPKSRALAAPK